MSSAFSGCVNTVDSEYQRIIRQLRAYGIEPTGDKSVDKAKLQKIEAVNTKNNDKKAETSQNTALTDNGQGTDQLAMLNKLKLGLL